MNTIEQMKKISIVLVVILIAMACYFFLQQYRFSDLMARGSEKEFIKAPAINFPLHKLGIKDN